MKTSIFTLKFLFLFSVAVSAQDNFRDTLSTDYPFFYDVEVKADVKILDGFYIYDFTIDNSLENKGIIISFRINLRDSLSYLPDTTGLRFKYSYLENSFRRMYNRIKSFAIPVGFPDSPGRW